MYIIYIYVYLDTDAGGCSGCRSCEEETFTSRERERERRGKLGTGGPPEICWTPGGGLDTALCTPERIAITKSPERV